MKAGLIRMKLRKTAMFITALMLIFMFSACTGGSDTYTPAQAVTDDDSAENITEPFGASGTHNNAPQEIHAETEATASDDLIHVHYESQPQVGQIIRFGAFDWRVIDIQDNWALILSDRILSSHSFNANATSGLWEHSDIRQYLNGVFYESNFSADERALIRETTVINNDNPWFGIEGGSDTLDRIFLLSIEEVVTYFGDSGQLRNRPGRYSWDFSIDDEFNANRATTYGESPFWWWLRSPGQGSFDAASVSHVGTINVGGNHSISRLDGVRPALWLDISGELPQPSLSAPVADLSNQNDLIHFCNYEWRILERQEGRALLLSEMVLETRMYHNRSENVTWETSDIRRFLNGEFYNSFSASDRARIIEVTNVNNDNQWFGTSGGRDTQDRVFLLSIEEVVRYFGDSGQLNNHVEGSQFINDMYNIERMGFWVEAGGNLSLDWLLRSPGARENRIIYVRAREGMIDMGGIGAVVNHNRGIRPALWISLD